MKNIGDIVAVVFDHGIFLELALRLARDFKTVYYVKNWQEAFPRVREWAVGVGFDELICVDEIWDVKDKIDLAIFPDTLHAGLQLELERQGIPVWGSRRGDDLELRKLQFKKLQAKLGMPLNKYEVVIGVEKLREYCKEHENKWIKLVRQFRGDRETFFHSTYEESRQDLDELALSYEGLQDKVGFIVEDPIESDDPEKPVTEGGIDSYVIDGQHPDMVVLGFEIKDHSYLATVKKYADVDESIRSGVEPLLPVLKEKRYRNWLSTESRNGILLEPTCREASPAGEEQLELYENLAEIILEGANGNLVQPKLTAKFACEATIEHKDDDEQTRSIIIPPEIKPWVKLYSCWRDGDTYHVKPGVNVIGAVVGIGDTPLEAIEHLKENAAGLSKKASVNVASLIEAVQEVQKAEESGVEFSDEELPDPVEVLDEK